MFDAICNDFGVLIPPYTFACLDQIVFFAAHVVDGGVDGVVGTVVVSTVVVDTVVVDTVVVDTVVVGGGGACCRLKTWARH